MNAPPQTVYIGLGSNLEHPRQQVTTGLQELAQLPLTRLLAQSSLYASDPLGPPDQPPYINAVACLETAIAPLPLLEALQTIEFEHRRVRKQHWGPRTLDLDILLYGERRIDLPRLQVPHPHMAQRSFVLVPLQEIAPQLSIPGAGPLAPLIAACDALGLRRLPD
jgi:2-amino-4-hydroxy-6-hydroxymethyldihydropteridine diphosphokinase